MIVEGALSVKAVIESQKREIKTVYIEASKKSKDIGYILAIAQQHGIEVRRISQEECQSIASGRTHGGVLCECGFRCNERLVLDQESIGSLVLCLEGINDPYNFGQICRNAFTFGVSTILYDGYQFRESEATLIKASAGCSERLVLVSSSALPHELNALKGINVHVYGAARFDNSLVLGQDKLIQPCCVCIGGEMRGLSKQVLMCCDQSVMIAYPGKARMSLTAVNASAVFCYELSR